MKTKKMPTVKAPRFEIALTLDEGQGRLATYDMWLILHVPDGKPPTTVRVDGGPFSREGAIKQMLEIYTEVGNRFAEATAKAGMLFPNRDELVQS